MTYPYQIFPNGIDAHCVHNKRHYLSRFYRATRPQQLLGFFEQGGPVFKVLRSLLNFELAFKKTTVVMGEKLEFFV